MDLHSMIWCGVGTIAVFIIAWTLHARVVKYESRRFHGGALRYQAAKLEYLANSIRDGIDAADVDYEWHSGRAVGYEEAAHELKYLSDELAKKFGAGFIFQA